MIFKFTFERSPLFTEQVLVIPIILVFFGECVFNMHFFSIKSYILQFRMPSILYQKSLMIGWDFSRRILWRCLYYWRLFLIWFRVHPGKDILCSKNLKLSETHICKKWLIQVKFCRCANVTHAVPIINRTFCIAICYRWEVRLSTDDKGPRSGHNYSII